MKVVVGLGNPGKRYEHTPHNIGFAVIEELAGRLSCVSRRSLRLRARIGKTIFNEERLLLVKPQTYMNNSGSAVASVLRYEKIAPTNMTVVMDDADLEIGRLRVRAGGGSGGHRGLGSVIQAVNTEGFARVRVGIGRRSGRKVLIEDVLTPFSRCERRQIEPAVEMAAEAVLCVIESGAEAAMNRFNGPDVGLLTSDGNGTISH